MAITHPTTEPEQVQTDTFAVFEEQGMFFGRVEVPRYATPESDAIRLNDDQRLEMAVYWAITDTFEEGDYPMLDGQEFGVMTDLDQPMETVEFRPNPTIKSCWNPNEETAEEWAETDDEPFSTETNGDSYADVRFDGEVVVSVDLTIDDNLNVVVHDGVGSAQIADEILVEGPEGE